MCPARVFIPSLITQCKENGDIFGISNAERRVSLLPVMLILLIPKLLPQGSSQEHEAMRALQSLDYLSRVDGWILQVPVPYLRQGCQTLIYHPGYSDQPDALVSPLAIKSKDCGCECDLKTFLYILSIAKQIQVSSSSVVMAYCLPPFHL